MQPHFTPSFTHSLTQSLTHTPPHPWTLSLHDKRKAPPRTQLQVGNGSLSLTPQRAETSSPRLFAPPGDTVAAAGTPIELPAGNESVPNYHFYIRCCLATRATRGRGNNMPRLQLVPQSFLRYPRLFPEEAQTRNERERT